MEKVIGIEISKNDFGIQSVIVNFINENKEKISKNYSLDNDELKIIIENRKKEIKEKLPDLEKKNKKYKTWNFLLHIAGGLFFTVLFISVALLFLFNISTTIPAILSIAFLAITYFQTENYSNNKNVYKEKRYNKDLENIEDILSEIESNKKNVFNNIVKENNLKNITRKSMINITSISSNILDFFYGFSLQVKKQTKNLYAIIKDDLLRESINDNQVNQSSSSETLVQKAIRNMEYNDMQRKKLNTKLENFENLVNTDRGGRGK